MPDSASCSPEDAINLGRDAIHAVHNPRQMYTGAIHIYGGDFFDKPRSEWADESSPEMPYSVEGAMRQGNRVIDDRLGLG